MSLDQKAIVNQIDAPQSAEYTKEQVLLTVQAERDLVSRHPA